MNMYFVFLFNSSYYKSNHSSDLLLHKGVKIHVDELNKDDGKNQHPLKHFGTFYPNVFMTNILRFPQTTRDLSEDM